MQGVSTFTFLVLLVLGLLIFYAFLWLVLGHWFRRKAGQITATLDAELSAAGARVLLGPAPGMYRGGTGDYPRVKGNAVLALTADRLVCRKLVGAPIEVPLDQVEGVREDRWFLRSYRSGRLHLILRLRGGVEVGFLCSDHPTWMSAVQDAVARRAGR